MKRVIGVLAALALLAGCGVSKQLVAEKDAALEAGRAEVSRLNGELAAAKSRGDKAEADLTACDTELQMARQEIAAARGAAEAARQEAQALKQREDDLRARLQGEIQDKTVEIENLRGRLSVRVVDKILFDSGSAAILPGGQKVLDKVAAALQGTSEMVRVEGHTDDVPIGPGLKDKYFSNWELSAARAASVVRYFQFGHQMAPQRLEAVGLSLYRPVAPNDNAADRQRNRRVEIVLTAAR
jgi:chemotaxis protein MotB